jgi:hypothetical protein
MTNEEAVRIGTLNLLGSDVEPPEIECWLFFEHIRAYISRWSPEHRTQLLELMTEAEERDQAMAAAKAMAAATQTPHLRIAN